MRRRLALIALALVAIAVVSGCSAEATKAPGVVVHRKVHDAPGPVMTSAPIAHPFELMVGIRVKTPTGNGIPNRFTIWRDPYEAKWMGTTSAGKQFYVGTQYDLSQAQSDAYEVLFLFTASGAFESATVIDFGSASGVASDFDTNVDQAVESEAREQLLGSLGAFRRTDIFIQPFAVKAYGLEFGFVPLPAVENDPEQPATIELLPANNMAFYAPWTYGHYDT
jgi:hypothetical protein